MELPAIDDINFLQNLINAIPYMVFVVDSDTRVYHMNSSAAQFLGTDIGRSRMMREGQVLKCVNHDAVPEGCGRSEFCRNCLVRGCVNEAMSGNRIYHRQTSMKITLNGRVADIHLLVSTSAFEFQGESFVLLILEDIEELVRLRSCLPICANCKKIRNDRNYWESVEQYLSTRHDLDFTHSICPDCRQLLYPELGKQ